MNDDKLDDLELDSIAFYDDSEPEFDDPMTLEDDFEWDGDEDWNDDMDGDHDSAMASAGFGTDEDYGCYGAGEDW